MSGPVHKLSLAEFLEWENAQPDRNEYYRGEVFAMTGAKRAHGRVVGNLMRHLGNQLGGSPCQVFAESMKLQIADDTILYPDVFVTCHPADLGTELIFRAPAVVIEVLSPSTQAYDRSKKFALYRRLASLKEYVLVDPDTRRVESFRLGPGGLWTLHDMSERPAMDLAFPPCMVAMEDLFAGVDPDGHGGRPSGDQTAPDGRSGSPWRGIAARSIRIRADAGSGRRCRVRTRKFSCCAPSSPQPSRLHAQSAARCR